MRCGHTIVFGAWQGDLLPGDGRLLLDLPVARRGADLVRGLTTAEFIVEQPTGPLPLSRWSSGSASYRDVDGPSPPSAPLTVPVRRDKGTTAASRFPSAALRPG
ncbi:hypothetical protein ACFYRY_06695 [Streptomyces sp. NPDC005263]|uniref:hypothetical protein n=1 Tax=Streptomyces sp. NPDC005263 TaxID=3364711 RepID=UPI0036C76186